MSFISPLSTKKPIPIVLVVAIAVLIAASLSQKVESAGDKTQAVTQPKGAVITQEQQAAKARRFRNLDIRVTEPKTMADIASANASVINQRLATRKTSVEQALTRLRTVSRGTQAKASPLTGAVEVLRSTTGALSTPASGRTGVDIVRSFITANGDLYGLSSKDVGSLRFLGESVNRGNGMRMVRVEQTANGLPIFQSETRFVLDSQGRVWRSTGLMIPSVKADPIEFESLISAEAALSIAASSVDIQADTDKVSQTSANVDGTELELAANNPNITGNVTSKLVYFPLAPGILVPAWSQVTFTNGSGDYYTLVDASSGKLLWRKNIRANVSTHDARFRVYVQADGTTPADSPAPLSPSNATVGGNVQPAGISPTIVSMFTAMSATASPNGWIDDCPGGVCTAAQTQTIGNNVHAYMDRVGGAGAGGADQPDTAASSVLDGNGKPMGNPDTNGRNRDFLGTTPRDFETNYLPPPQGGNPEAGQTPTGNGNNGTLPVDQFRRGMITQLFYVSNWYHDKTFLLGFDEAAGNFQLTNFSGMGLGNDRVLAEGQDSAGTDNANFSTPPDGQSGRAQMFRFIGPTVDRDGSLDTEILIHELTHGLSNRLVGNAAGLVWDPGAGMGEGWSDFYSMSLLNNTNADDPNGMYAQAAYTSYKIFGITTFTDNYVYGSRRFPYSTNNSINPLTWADVDDWTNNLSGGIAPDPIGFNIGGASEVHNIGEIWALTLWEVRARIIAANSNSVPTGNQIMLQLVTDALKMTPNNPTFTDARDALIDADCATNSCANEQSIWDGFADRGLGYGSRVSTAYGFAPVASHQGIVESFSAPGLDVQSVSVDDSIGNNNGAIDPGESVKITVTLANPWRSTSKNVASATATLTTGTAGINITDNSSTYGAIPAQGSAAGDSFQFSVPLLAGCGSSLNFTITSTSSLGVKAVPFSFRVGAPSGTGAPITYTRTPGAPLAIQDNRPRGTIDSQTITDDFEIADLNVRIDSLPHTFPGDVTFGFKAPNGYGVDVVTFIGGAVAGGGDGDNITNMVLDNQAAGDILLATNAQAPYTGSWLPIANSPSWPVLGFGPAEPVGELNKMNGASTLGTWQVLASDQAAIDTGTLGGWSLIVTPRAFSCTPVAGPAATAGQLLISEFRVRGPSGANDEFVEIYNNSGADHTVSDSGAGTGYAVAASDGVARCVIPNGTVIPNRGHYLCTNSVAYSLSGNATGNATYTTDIPDNAGIALFNTSVAANFTLANRLDAVGSTSEANTLYKEGTGYSALTPFSIDYSFVRDECGKQGSITTFGNCPSGGNYVDTNSNAVDFYFVDTNGTSAGAGQRLGAPGPQNLASPIQRTASFPFLFLDNTVAAANPPNRVRDFTSDPANNSTFGTLDFRRRVVNSTGGAVTRLRYRIIDLTTFPAPSGISDLRPRTSSLVVVSGINDSATCLASNGVATTPCTVNVQGTTLEQPPSQPNGGGFNSTWSSGTVTLGTPLANGASINIRLLFGIQQTGNFKFFMNIEALP
ncbi:MAG TPA: M36 family metallopeptidase [Pyrinomonadaceae bacterium]|nr:M36 family metallopeptidase [Pyrinomonadaceae bacterium]